MQPASGRAKLGRKALAGEQVRPWVRLEELPHRGGSQVLPGRRARRVAGMADVGVEDQLGTARDKKNRGMVLEGGRAGAAPARRSAARGRRDSRVWGIGRTARPFTIKGECRCEPSKAAVGLEGDEVDEASFSASLSQMPCREWIRGA